MQEAAADETARSSHDAAPRTQVPLASRFQPRNRLVSGREGTVLTCSHGTGVAGSGGSGVDVKGWDGVQRALFSNVTQLYAMARTYVYAQPSQAASVASAPGNGASAPGNGASAPGNGASAPGQERSNCLTEQVAAGVHSCSACTAHADRPTRAYESLQAYADNMACVSTSKAPPAPEQTAASGAMSERVAAAKAAWARTIQAHEPSQKAPFQLLPACSSDLLSAKSDPEDSLREIWASIAEPRHEHVQASSFPLLPACGSDAKGVLDASGSLAARVNRCACSNIRTYIHTHIHTYIHSLCTRACTYTCTCMHTCTEAGLGMQGARRWHHGTGDRHPQRRYSHAQEARDALENGTNKDRRAAARRAR